MYKYVFTSFFYTSTWVKILNTGLFTYSFNSFTYSVKQKVCRRLPRMFGAINPPHFPSNCKPNTEQQKSGKENKSRAEWMCWGLVGWRSCRWGFSPSLSLSLWLQRGVPLTPAPHLHVQKSPVLECRGVSSRRQRVWSNQCAICLSAYESSPILGTDMLFWRVTRGFFQPAGLFPGEISVQGGVRKWHAGHSCLSRFLPSMFVFLFPYPDSIWMELNLEPGGWFWRSFLGVPVHKRSPEGLKLGVRLKDPSCGRLLFRPLRVL